MLRSTEVIVGFWIFLATLFPFCGPFILQSFASEDGSCLNCHMEFKKPSIHEHGALGLGCSACHTSAPDNIHPQQKDSIRLVKNVPDLCFDCHKKSKFQDMDVHLPVSSGRCTYCHNPHRSAFSSLLSCDPPELCYGCHDRAKFTKKYVHPIIIGRRCDCHNPHASNYPRLLSATVNEVCISCHTAKRSGQHVVSLANGKIHPVAGVITDQRNRKKRINCATCHNPHSSDFRKLFPKARVCRICHKYY